MSSESSNVGDVADDNGRTTDGDQVRQFVTYYLGSDCFAFPMDRVLEIIRVPKVVSVPLTPRGFLGLSNLRGTILPIMDLRTSLGLELREPDDATRTVVVDCGRPLGLVVDRVARVVGFTADRIEPPEAAGEVQSSGRIALLSGVVKDSDGVGLIQILDPTAVVDPASFGPDHDAAAAQGTVAGAKGGPVMTARTRGSVSDQNIVSPSERETPSALQDDRPAGLDQSADGSCQLVSLIIDGQEYGFDISEVDEIVRPPESVFRVPMSAGHVLGMINLRNRLLPIVSLRRMFHLADLPVSEANRILVMRLGGTGDIESRVGVVVDQVQEVLSVPARDMVRTSGLVHGDGIERIGTMCRLDDGKRLLGFLSARTLFADPHIRDAVSTALANSKSEAGDGSVLDGRKNAADGENAAKAPVDADREPLGIDKEHPGEAVADNEEGEGAMNDPRREADETQLVVYQLSGQEYGVEITAVREIIRVPPTLNRIPRAPDYVAGIINLRGAVLPVVSMRLRFAIPEANDSERQRIMVLSVDGTQTGFIVDSVTEVLRLPRSRIEPSPNLSRDQGRLIGTVANLDDGKRFIQILDAEAILDGTEQADLAMTG